MFRRGPAIALSLVLSAAVLAVAPSAVAGDGGTAKDTDPCSKSSKVKIKAAPYGDDRFEVTGVVFSDDGDNWDWRFKHEEDLSAKGQAKADGDGEGRSFKVVRTMVNFPGATDHLVFRATNERTGEVCRVDVHA